MALSKSRISRILVCCAGFILALCPVSNNSLRPLSLNPAMATCHVTLLVTARQPLDRWPLDESFTPLTASQLPPLGVTSPSPLSTQGWWAETSCAAPTQGRRTPLLGACPLGRCHQGRLVFPTSHTLQATSGFTSHRPRACSTPNMVACRFLPQSKSRQDGRDRSRLGPRRPRMNMDSPVLPIVQARMVEWANKPVSARPGSTRESATRRS